MTSTFHEPTGQGSICPTCVMHQMNRVKFQGSITDGYSDDDPTALSSPTNTTRRAVTPGPSVCRSSSSFPPESVTVRSRPTRASAEAIAAQDVEDNVEDGYDNLCNVYMRLRRKTRAAGIP